MILNRTPLPEPLPGQIHLWSADILDWLPEMEKFYPAFSAYEIQRMHRFKIPEKQAQFICCRGLVRSILAAYLQVSPANLQLMANPAGKPFLAIQPLQFNLSHSGGKMVLGISQCDQIGVDIQEMYPISNLDAVIRSYFSAGEAAYLASLPGESRRKVFFGIWTAKEAYQKALGMGFSKSSKSFDLLPESGQDSTYLLSDPAHHGGVDNWNIQALDLAEGFQGAVAVDGNLEKILPIPLYPGDLQKLLPAS